LGHEGGRVDRIAKDVEAVAGLPGPGFCIGFPMSGYVG